jgi:putative flippase GtrA
MTPHVAPPSLPRRLAGNLELRFLAAGAWNTLFGYLVFVAMYAMLGDRLGTTALLCASYAISLVQAFAVQRQLVFRATGDRLLPQFLRFLASNSLVFLANLLFLPLAIAGTTFSPLLLQAVFVVMSTLASYVLHKHFSFAKHP